MAIPKILIEHSVFYTLITYENIEMIILKGHLTLELLMSRIIPNKNVSFYGKSLIIQKIDELEFEGSMLLELNMIRNNLAHNYEFKLEESGIIEWSNKIITKLEHTKFSRHTKKTKIAHAFSALALKICEYPVKYE